MVNHEWAWWLGAVSAVTFVGSLVVLPILLAATPADYFVRPEHHPKSWTGRHPLLRWTLFFCKNVLGVVLVLAGLIMIVGPGQGVLTVLLGISLLDVPGKRGFELWLVRRPHVLGTINWIRRRAKHPPLQMPQHEIPPHHP